MNQSVLICNESTVLKDGDIQSVLPALQHQLTNQFLPAYVGHGLPNPILRFGPPASLQPREWQIVMLDVSDVAGALGYHDTTEHGDPFGKVFAKTDMLYGSLWTVTLSHELLELVLDPRIDKTIGGHLDGKKVRFSVEDCDACEADQFAYEVAGGGASVKLSDFVLPEWFQDKKHKPGTKFSYRNNLSGPFALAEGGYVSYMDRQGNWHDKMADERPGYEQRPRVGSRRERRRTGQERWLASLPHQHRIALRQVAQEKGLLA